MTATPPRADLRTLAAEGGAPMTDQVAASPQSLCDHPAYVHHVRGGEPLTIPLCQLCGEIGWDDLREQVAEHRRMVLTEAVDDLHRVATHLCATNPDSSVAKGVRYAEARIRAQLTTAPPAGLSAPVPAGNAPAVPEGACDRCTGLFMPGDKIVYDADGQYHAEHFPAAPEEADGQQAGEGDALTYAEMEAERDRLAGEVFTLTNSEGLAVVAAELERDEARAAVDALSDAGTQPCPTPSDAKSGMVPLVDVLDALRDHDGFVDWTRTKGPRGYIDDYVVRQYRESCADYLAERFAPTAPEVDRG